MYELNVEIYRHNYITIILQLKAVLQTFKVREERLLKGKSRFKRTKFISNINRFGEFAEKFVHAQQFVYSCLNWDNYARSISAFIVRFFPKLNIYNPFYTSTLGFYFIHLFHRSLASTARIFWDFYPSIVEYLETSQRRSDERKL